jgi:hypothetical protein
MSARDTRTVEERLARTKTILVAMQCVAIAVDDCVGDTAATTGWLYMMAAEEEQAAVGAFR